ncbi:hypothetical protein HK096_010977, partial [Nowakowskiella sp. JEL0078]
MEEDKKSTLLSVMGPSGSLPSFKKSDKPIISPEPSESPEKEEKMEEVIEKQKHFITHSNPIKRYRRSSSTDRDSEDQMENSDSIDNEVKPKKRVSWAADEKLVAIKFFTIDDEDMTNFKKHEHGSARDEERGEGSKWKAQKVIKSTIEFTNPIPFQPEGDSRKIISQESVKQEEREKRVLARTYYSDDHIPDSPAEPTEEESKPSIYKVIPLSLVDETSPMEQPQQQQLIQQQQQLQQLQQQLQLNNPQQQSQQQQRTNDNSPPKSQGRYSREEHGRGRNANRGRGRREDIVHEVFVQERSEKNDRNDYGHDRDRGFDRGDRGRGRGRGNERGRGRGGGGVGV